MNNLVASWYPAPTEVRFRIARKVFHIGIAYQDYIIDLSTGDIHLISNILQRAIDCGENSDDAIIEWCVWVPLKEIL